MSKPCALCGSTERDIVCERAALKRGETRAVTNVLCRACGFIFNDPEPSEADLTQYYQGEFAADKTTSSYEGIVERLQVKMQDPTRKELKVVEFLAPYLKEGVSVVDIGCSTGSLLADLRRRYAVDATGVEPDATYVRVAHEHLAIPQVHQQFLDGFSAGNTRVYDVVILRHVLEHLSDPNKRIEQLKTMLAPQGVLYLAFPNAVRLTPSRALSHCLEFGHLSTFSPWTIHHFLQRHGMKIVRWSFDPSLQLQIVATRIETPIEPVPYAELREGSDPAQLLRRLRAHGRRHFFFRVLRKLKNIFG
ncbi:MAG: class I SAM-dependent methyltransferase [Patescibacteria group bacterium]